MKPSIAPGAASTGAGFRLAPHFPVVASQNQRSVSTLATVVMNARISAAVGDQGIAGNDWNSSSPAYGIVRAQAYRLDRVYFQGVRDGQVERIDVSRLDAAAPKGCEGWTKYVSLFSSRYHGSTGPVVVKPAEVQIVRVTDEIADSAWLALPGLVWVGLAWSIYQYGEAHGFVF